MTDPDLAAPMPRRVRRILQGGFASSSANRLLQSWQAQGRPNHVHPGGLFGIVLAWLWEDDHDEAMIFLAGYLAELNIHHPEAGAHGSVSLEDLLAGLRLAMPQGFDDLPELCAAARAEVAGHYGGPI